MAPEVRLRSLTHVRPRMYAALSRMCAAPSRMCTRHPCVPSHVRSSVTHVRPPRMCALARVAPVYRTITCVQHRQACVPLGSCRTSVHLGATPSHRCPLLHVHLPMCTLAFALACTPLLHSSGPSEVEGTHLRRAVPLLRPATTLPVSALPFHLPFHLKNLASGLTRELKQGASVIINISERLELESETSKEEAIDSTL